MPMRMLIIGEVDAPSGMGDGPAPLLSDQAQPMDAQLMAAVLGLMRGNATLPTGLPAPADDAVALRAPAMQALLRRVAQVAPSSAPVLISGESGTGKSTIATLLHRGSGRADKPFVVLNCTALSDPMFERELFGAEIGSFVTLPPPIGKFAAAMGGTLLLDDVSELDARQQALLLRALQLNEAEGGPRILATTSHDLVQEAQCGRFRTDLLLRLNVVTVKVPALRDRPEDLLALAEHFARMFGRESDRPAPALHDSVKHALLQHGWPGNVRELRNVIHRAVLEAGDAPMTTDSLDLDPLDSPAAPEAPPALNGGTGISTAGRTIQAVEKDMILETLARCKGNRGQTATVLGISIRTLRNKLHEYERDGTRIPRPVIVAVA